MQGLRGQVVNYPDRHHQLLRPRVPVRTCGLALRSLTLQIVLFFALVQDFNLAPHSSHSLTSFLLPMIWIKIPLLVSDNLVTKQVERSGCEIFSGLKELFHTSQPFTFQQQRNTSLLLVQGTFEIFSTKGLPG